MDFPYFKYHPNPAAVFETASGTCESCGVRRGREYIGPQYGRVEVEHLCARCIGDGTAAAKFNVIFTDPDGAEPGPGRENVDELLHRTPGYLGPEGDPWPAHCGDFCAHLGQVTWLDLQPHLAELDADIESISALTGVERSDLSEELGREVNPLHAYLFRCLVCGHHRLVADYECG
jgi:hypothetical protein